MNASLTPSGPPAAGGVRKARQTLLLVLLSTLGVGVVAGAVVPTYASPELLSVQSADGSRAGVETPLMRQQSRGAESAPVAVGSPQSAATETPAVKSPRSPFASEDVATMVVAGLGILAVAGMLYGVRTGRIDAARGSVRL